MKVKKTHPLTIEELRKCKGFERRTDQELENALTVMERFAKMTYEVNVVGSFNIELKSRRNLYGKS